MCVRVCIYNLIHAGLVKIASSVNVTKVGAKGAKAFFDAHADANANANKAELEIKASNHTGHGFGFSKCRQTS